LIEPVYCTWSHRDLLPPTLRGRFRDLDHFLRELLASAHSRLVIVAPYLSPAGLGSLRGAMAASAQRGAWIRVITGELEDPDSWNRRALRELVTGHEGDIVRKRMRVLTGSQGFRVLLHAKIIVADGDRGYMGSANLSWSALEENLELGLSLSASQAGAVEGLISSLESRGLLEDRTDLVVGRA
jgi:phosphatidylserine/phosphatidylglycerophosphate/cardiolipin synthase-like enzyme